MLHRLTTVFLGALLCCLPTTVCAAEDHIVTFWPLVDVRSSAAVDYTSVNLLGPLFNYEKKGSEREVNLRPLYFHARDDQQVHYRDFLYPVAQKTSEPDRSYFHLFHLLHYDFGVRETGSNNEFNLFPFLFYGQHQEQGDSYAFFPLGGRIYDKFGRDEIRFGLFPLYGWTRKEDRTVTNLLWPIYARIQGEQESGLKLWPLYGSSSKAGVYRKQFFLWPFFFAYDIGLDTEAPLHRRAVFPFYIRDDAPRYTARTYLWPFFSRIDNRAKNYREWNFPWPLVRITRGQNHHGNRFLPLYARELSGSFEKQWYLWPFYKIETTETEIFIRRRQRLLFFLFSHLEETVYDEVTPREKRIAFWPLFTYERLKGVSHFWTFSLLEPFFPGNAGIGRNWAPLWRFYQSHWDQHGNSASSFLWNLYWKERRGDDLAMELFPLFLLQRQGGEIAEFSLFKGLFRYRSSTEGKKVSLLYLPWGVKWKGPDEG